MYIHINSISSANNKNIKLASEVRNLASLKNENTVWCRCMYTCTVCMLFIAQYIQCQFLNQLYIHPHHSWRNLASEKSTWDFKDIWSFKLRLNLGVCQTGFAEVLSDQTLNTKDNTDLKLQAWWVSGFSLCWQMRALQKIGVKNSFKYVNCGTGGAVCNVSYWHARTSGCT